MHIRFRMIANYFTICFWLFSIDFNDNENGMVKQIRNMSHPLPLNKSSICSKSNFNWLQNGVDIKNSLLFNGFYFLFLWLVDC